MQFPKTGAGLIRVKALRQSENPPTKEQTDYHIAVRVVMSHSNSILFILSGKSMMSFRTAPHAAVLCAVAILVSFRGQTAFAEDALSDQCLRFTCQENYLRCTGGGHMSAVIVEANPAVKGCPSRVTVTYDGDKSSATPFRYYSCGCRHPDIAKITK
jgi:hypothetical protein